MASDDLRATVRDLFVLLRQTGVDTTLVGGVALLLYVAGRNTEDIDLIVDPNEEDRWPWQVESRDENFGRAVFSGVRVDLLFSTNPVFAHVRKYHTEIVATEEGAIRCATREGMLLLKLYALPSLYRQGNTARAALYEADLRMLLQNETIEGEELQQQLAPHMLASDITELGNVVRELRSKRRTF